MQQVNVTLFDTLRILLTLMRRLKRQERHFQEQLPPLLESLSAGQQQQFPAAVIKRIKKYWELSLHVICNSLYELSGQSLSAAERQRILLLSIFGPLYDDLLDERLLSSEQLERFTLHPAAHIPASFTEQVAREAYLRLLHQSPDPGRVMEQLHCLLRWQQASLRQLSPDVAEAALYEITYKKSYYAILLYCSILDHYPAQKIRNMLYPVAGLLQLTNDAFDVYKDIQSGVYTLPNLYCDFNKLQQHFMDSVAAFNRQLAALPYHRYAKMRYGVTIHALHGMGYMAL
ncbi:MAG TPA: class 1 isoprenoid biosynthesis enzyme, partial [Chitinophaga sp.]